MRVSLLAHLDGVVRVGDERDEQTEHHVDEQRHKRVEIQAAEEPHHVTLLLHVLEGGEHVVAVDEGKQTLGNNVQRPELMNNTNMQLRKSCVSHVTQ